MANQHNVMLHPVERHADGSPVRDSCHVQKCNGAVVCVAQRVLATLSLHTQHKYDRLGM